MRRVLLGPGGGGRNQNEDQRQGEREDRSQRSHPGHNEAMVGRGPSRQPLRTRVRAAGYVALLMLGTSFLGACGDSTDSTSTDSTATTPPPGALVVAVDPPRGERGDAMQATVVNGTDEQYTYGAAYELETQADGSWQKVKLPPTPVIEIGYVAPPGEEGPPVDFKIPDDAIPGTWRIVIARDAPGGGPLAGTFEVTGG